MVRGTLIRRPAVRSKVDVAFADGSAVVLTGPAGIGKTTALQELVDGQGATVLRATPSTRPIPLGVFGDWSAVEASEGGTVGVRVALAQLRETGALLAVDDADHLDDVSATLLADAMRGGLRALLCTRQAADLSYPLLRLVDSGQLRQVPVEPLTALQAQQLVRSTAQVPLSTPMLERVLRLGEGNPLLLTEFARSLPESDTDDLQLNERLRRLVRSRLERLDAAARDVAELLAYDGPLPLALLCDMADRDAVDALEHARIVRVDHGPARQVGLAHPLTREVLAEWLTTTGRTRHAAALAAALAPHVDQVVDGVVRGARWQLDAGVTTDPVMLRDAATTLLARWDTDTATLMAGLAAAALPDDPQPVHVLATAATIRHAFAEAEALYTRLVGDFTLPAAMLVRAAIGHAQAVFLGSGDHDRAIEVLRADLSELPDSDAAVTAMTAVLHTLGGDHDGAVAAARAVPADAAAFVRATAAAAGINGLLWTGRIGEANAWLDRMAPLYTDPTVAPDQHTQMITQLLMARAHLGELDDPSPESVPPAADPVIALDLPGGHRQIMRGRGDLADALLRRAESRLGLNDSVGIQPWAASMTAELACLQGDAARAADAARWARTTHNPNTSNGQWFPSATAGWAAAVAGRIGHATQLFRRAASDAACHNDRLHHCTQLIAALRLGAVELASDVVSATSRVDSPLYEAVGTAAGGIAMRDAGAIRQGAEALANMQALLWAVDLLAVGHTALHGTGGEGAAALLRSAWELADNLVGMHPPSLQRIRSGWHDLTDRQYEIARLAAGGRTSSEIAKDLVISVRTVDNHLSRVYRQLGITSRHDLAGALGRFSSVPSGPAVAG